MKLFSWIKKHPVEAALLVGGAAFLGPEIGLLAGAGEGAAGAGAAAGVAGGTLGAEWGGMIAAEAAGAGVGGVSGAGGSALLGSAGLGGVGGVSGAGGSALLGSSGLGSVLGDFGVGAEQAGAMYGGAGYMPGYMSSAENSLFGAQNTLADTKAAFGASPGWKIPELNPKNALLLSQVMGMGQQPSRPMGAPIDMGNPMQRQATMTQEDITKKWLLHNDPNTYARIYGAPQQMGA